MRPTCFSISGALAHSLMAAGLAAALASPASASADDLFNRDTLLEDAGVMAAMKVLRRYPSLDKPKADAFDAACWEAAAGQKTTKAQRTACLQAAAQLLGSESRFLLADDVLPMHAGPKSFGGIGVLTDQATDGVEVVDVLREGPAHRAGVEVGDRLTHVDGMPISGQSIDAVPGLLRGESGSRVRLDTVSKTGARRSIEVERAGVSWPTETARPVPGGWYLQLRSITKGSDDRVRALIEGAHAGGELTGTMVLDLRGNTGGAAEFMVDVARALLHRDNIKMMTLSTAGNDIKYFGGVSYGSERHFPQPYRLAQAALQAMPLVVLTDDRTGSGGIWLLATLRAHRNTYTMGTATSISAITLQQANAYGDGAGQFLLPDGYLYAPGGEALHGTGIAPDIPMPSEPAITGKPPSWLQAALTAHEARLRLPRLAPPVAPGGASLDSQTRQCLGPISLVASAAPRRVETDDYDNRIRLGDTSLFSIEHNEAEYRAALKERADSIREGNATLMQQAIERISNLSEKSLLNGDDKQTFEKLKASLNRLRNPPDRHVADHPGATLLTRLALLDVGTSELWWWYDGVTYVLRRRLEDGDDMRGLTSWLKHFEPGVPSLPDTSPALCLPNARLTLPPGVGPVEGRIRFKLAATGDSLWVLSFSDRSLDTPSHDDWLLAGRYPPFSAQDVNPDCRQHDRLRQGAPRQQSIAGRPGISMQHGGLTCGLSRAAMLPVLGKKDPWNLAFGLSPPGPGEAARTAWRLALESVRWGPLPGR